MIRTVNTNTKHINLGKKYTPRSPMDMKPTGLWYDIDNDWTDWCSTEMPNWVYKYQFQIEIDESKLLIIKSPKELWAFCEKYSALLLPDTDSELQQVKWLEVKEQYAGIEIQNYRSMKGATWQDKRMWSNIWFSSWDVSSGCIWDLSIIKKIIGNIKEVNIK